MLGRQHELLCICAQVANVRTVQGKSLVIDRMQEHFNDSMVVASIDIARVTRR